MVSLNIVVHLTENQRDEPYVHQHLADGTGFTFTAAKCINGTQEADPYTRDADGTLCTASGHVANGQGVNGAAAANPIMQILMVASVLLKVESTQQQLQSVLVGILADPYIEDSDGTIWVSEWNI